MFVSKKVYSDSLIVGCRDHADACVARNALGIACGAHTGINYFGGELTGFEFRNFRCSGPVVSEIGKRSDSSGVRDLVFRATTVAATPVSQYFRFNVGGTRKCGRVGGTNGASMRCDAHSRMVVRDADGTFFGRGQRGATVLNDAQHWPGSLTRACRSADHRARQDCMWWMKDQPGLRAVAEAGGGRMGIQRETAAGGNCTRNALWPGYLCNAKISRGWARLWVRDPMPANGAHAARLVGPVGVSQVSAYWCRRFPGKWIPEPLY